MRVLVTGSTGILGRQVVDRLLAEGYDVAVVTRRLFAAESAFAQRAVHITEWHPMSDPMPDGALDGVEAIVNLAGEPITGAFGPDRLARLKDSRITVAERLAAATRGRQIRVVGVSVVLPPESSGSDDILTDLSPRPELSSGLARDLLATEAACNAITASGAGVAIVRLGIVLAPGPLLATLVRLAERGRVPRLDGALIPAIAIEDAAALIAGLVSQPQITGPLIGVAPEPLPGAALSRALANLSRVPVALPLRRRGLERHIGPLAGLLYNRVRVVPQRLLDAGAGFQHADLEATLARTLSTVCGADGPDREPNARWRWLAGLLPSRSA